MAGERPVLDLGTLDRMGLSDSPIHRLDPRAKLLVTFAFLLAVVSHDKYAVSALTPFFLYPAVLLALSCVPVTFLLCRLLWAAPFAVLLGAFNPLIDHAPLLTLGGLDISGGWVSFASILLRFALVVSALVLLVATTGVPALAHAAQRLGMPRAFVVQLLMLYRYLFVLAGEAGRMARAHRLRAGDRRAAAWRVFARMAGQLLLRALDRADRIHRAMLCRVFDGRVPMLDTLRFRPQDWGFLLGWLALFAFLRGFEPARLLGSLILGGGS